MPDLPAICLLCGFNNCANASESSPYCCWCYIYAYDYSSLKPYCFSNYSYDPISNIYRKDENAIIRTKSPIITDCIRENAKLNIFSQYCIEGQQYAVFNKCISYIDQDFSIIGLLKNFDVALDLLVRGDTLFSSKPLYRILSVLQTSLFFPTLYKYILVLDV